MRDAGAMFHLARPPAPMRPNTIEHANLGTALRTVHALEASSVRRVVFLSYATAGTGRDHSYLRANTRAEEVLAESARQVVVLWTTFVFGPIG